MDFPPPYQSCILVLNLIQQPLHRSGYAWKGRPSSFKNLLRRQETAGTPSAHQPTWRATPKPQAPQITTTTEHKQLLDAKKLHNSRCVETEPVVPPFITLIGDESPWQRAMYASACWFSPGSAASASTMSCVSYFHYSYGQY